MLFVHVNAAQYCILVLQELAGYERVQNILCWKLSHANLDSICQYIHFIDYTCKYINLWTCYARYSMFSYSLDRFLKYKCIDSYRYKKITLSDTDTTIFYQRFWWYRCARIDRSYRIEILLVCELRILMILTVVRQVAINISSSCYETWPIVGSLSYLY